MATTSDNLEKIGAARRRPEVEGPLGGGLATQQMLRQALAVQPRQMDGSLPGLAQVGAALPEDKLPPMQRAAMRKVTMSGQASMWRSMSQGMIGCQSLPGLKLPAQPTAADMTDLAERAADYDAIKRAADAGLSSFLDLRLLCGGYGKFVLRRTLQAVEARLADPAVPEAQKDELRDAFSGLLLARERVAADNVGGRAESAADRARREEEMKDAEGLLQMQDVFNALRAGQKVDPVALGEAALRFDQLQRQRAAQAEAPVAAADPSRKLRR